ncbi:uncharacterized protein LOC141901996 isoform X1 [Tubulanus polymorphus]|uniref:uncharacterized protein LOC141901996 isoform X1 n=1 Tax=Tubulanus polymorphus TaxID=672921 RepID=UPI003DA316F4
MYICTKNWIEHLTTRNMKTGYLVVILYVVLTTVLAADKDPLTEELLKAEFEKLNEQLLDRRDPVKEPNHASDEDEMMRLSEILKRGTVEDEKNEMPLHTQRRDGNSRNTAIKVEDEKELKESDKPELRKELLVELERELESDKDSDKRSDEGSDDKKRSETAKSLWEKVKKFVTGKKDDVRKSENPNIDQLSQRSRPEKGDIYKELDELENERLALFQQLIANLQKSLKLRSTYAEEMDADKRGRRNGHGGNMGLLGR